jgi:hypothetical protein
LLLFFVNSLNISRYNAFKVFRHDLTLPAKISALVTLGKVIKPFFNSSNALLLVQDHFPDGTFTLPTIKVGLFQYNTLFSIGVIRVSLPSAKTLV